LDKAPDAFRTISEVAEDLDVPQHVLRFWESRFNQIKPMKRGGGRRYYRPEDVELLRGIRHLLYGEGYTIRGVQRILRDQGVKFVQAVWQEGAAQPAHRAGPELDDAAPDEAEAEDDAAEAEAEAPRSRGVFGRIPALFSREADQETPEDPQERREPALSGASSAAPRRPPVAMPSIDNMMAAPGTVSAGLSRDDLRKLQASLHELTECRRLLQFVLDERN
jgi:DNA-binding transcriptional MerR regulator